MNKPPLSYWIIAIVAFLWNLMGVAAYLGQSFMSDAQIAEAYGVEAAAAIAAQPAWYTAVFALAVFGGAIGCLGLLLRKAWAQWPLVVSLVCVVLQNIYFAMNGVFADIHGGQWAMTILIPIIAVFLVWFARRRIADGTLR
jgi:uncharacterized membrane protein